MGVWFNQYWLPTSYFDGGQYVMQLNGQGAYGSGITICGQRTVVPLDLRVWVDFLGAGALDIHVVLRHWTPNTAPNQADPPTGPISTHTYKDETYTGSGTDPDGDAVYYRWDIDGMISEWDGPYASGEATQYMTQFATTGTKQIRFKVMDEYQAEADWSEPLTVEVWLCGDADGSGGVDIDDAVYLIQYIFNSGPDPEPIASGNADCAADVDIDDVVYLIQFIFLGGPYPCDPIQGQGPDC